MSISEDPGVIDRTTRLLQVIVFALTAGLLTFLAVTVFVRLQAKPPPPPAAGAPPGLKDPLPVLTVAAYTFAAILIPLSFVVPGIMTDAAVKKVAAGTWMVRQGPGGSATPVAVNDAQRLAMVYQQGTILGAALNEGPAFLALVAYMIEGHAIALVLALALIAGVVSRFPRREAVEAWVDDRLARVQMERRSTPGIDS